MEFMPVDEIHRILKLYPSLSVKDRLIMISRLLFCLRSIMDVLSKYLPEEGLVVDLGCGYGMTSHLVSIDHPQRTVIGVDISKTRIEVARSSVSNNGNVEFYNEDIRNFYIPSCSAIIIVDVLSMFSYVDQELVLRRCYDSLKVNGIMIIRDNCTFPRWKYRYMCFEESIKSKLKIYGKEIKDNPVCVWDNSEFMNLLKNIGFSVSSFRQRSYLPYPGIFYICYKRTRETS